jgi:uncharacterized protein YggU (UPF0235/DUF167 family)
MYIHVAVTPSARKEVFEQIKPDHFVVKVKERAQRNMANERVKTLIARHFKLPVGKVRIVSGHRSPSKLFSLDSEL